MGIKNENVQKKSWFVITDRTYEFEEVMEDYEYPVSRYNPIEIGPKEWDTKSSYKAAGFRISATRRELMELLRDFKETYPDACMTVLRS